MKIYFKTILNILLTLTQLSLSTNYSEYLSNAAKEVRKAATKKNLSLYSKTIHGNWGDWSAWSKCSKSCDKGIQKKTRKCDNPKPKGVAADHCPGIHSDEQYCNDKKCPIDGRWSKWTDWTICSQSCDSGTQTKTRSCTNPSPQFGGQKCKGKSKEETSCKTEPCPIDGHWSKWTDWTICSQSCGGGTQTKTRSCKNPSPQFGGQKCKGKSKDKASCKTEPCPIEAFSTMTHHSRIFRGIIIILSVVGIIITVIAINIFTSRIQREQKKTTGNEDLIYLSRTG